VLEFLFLLLQCESFLGVQLGTTAFDQL